jgi:hypothetical protein
VHEGDARALRASWAEFQKTLLDLTTAVLGPLTRPKQAVAPKPRFMAYPRNARTVVLHDRQTDRLLPLPAGDEREVARLLCIHPGAFWSTEAARAEVHLAIVQGRGDVVLPGVHL